VAGGFFSLWSAAAFRPARFFALPAEARANWPARKFSIAVYAVFATAASAVVRFSSTHGRDAILLPTALVLILSPLYALVSVYVSALCIQLGLILARAPGRRFTETREVVGYSSAGLVLAAVPFVGWLAALILYFRAIYRGLRVRSSLPRIRAALIVLIFAAVSSSAPLLARRFVLEPFSIPSGSMMPAVLAGDEVFVNKLAYLSSTPRRGDAVVFASPKNPDVDYLKRVAGLAGDAISIRHNELFINGVTTRLPGQGRPYEYSDRTEAGETVTVQREAFTERLGGIEYPVLVQDDQSKDHDLDFTVPPGMIYVLGDNRDSSLDSRFLGPVPLGFVKGRAELVWLSADGDTLRWKRTGMRIPHAAQ
jgi:signal peptidase I